VADATRRSQLLGLKLAALVRDHVGSEPTSPPVPGLWPGGAALLRDGAAWILVEDEPSRAVGRGLAWAQQQGATLLHLLAESGSGVLARKAAYFAEPPQVWHINGRALVEAIPEPFPDAAAVDPELAVFADLIVDGGAVPVVEHGVLAGEVMGLEVCRAVRDPYTDECRLEVGVGAHDREAFLLIHGGIPTVEALRMVVEAVARHRAPGADPHPLNRLGAERALRARLIEQPVLVGASSLLPAEPPVARANLKDAVPCVALGNSNDGTPLVVVCSTGIDLDIVPWAADAREYLRPDADLVIAQPERDVSPVTHAIAGMLRKSVRIVSIPAA